MVTYWLIPVLFILLFSGLPVAYCLGTIALIGMYVITGTGDALVGTMYSALESWVLLAVPFFIYVADVLVRSKTTDALIKFVEVVFWWYKNRLIVVAIGACALFAAMCGSSVATALAIGKTLIPQMRERGYDLEIACGSIACAGALGILIPPSIIFIIYGSIAEISIGDLFIAGIVPGIVLAVIYALISVFIKKKQVVKEMPRITWQQGVHTFIRAIPGLTVPLFMIGGIYLGWFTPTEAGATGSVLAIFIGLTFYKGFKVKELLTVSADAAIGSSMIMIIVAAALALGYLFTLDDVTVSLISIVEAVSMPQWVFLLILNVFLIFLGMLIDASSIMLITVPLILPLAAMYNVDLYHLGIIMTVNMGLAVVTPPVGMNLYAVSAISGIPINRVLRGVLPFLLAEFVFLIFVTYYPSFSLFLIR